MKSICLLLLSIYSVIGFAQKGQISGVLTGFKEGDEIILGDMDLGETVEKTTLNNGTFRFRNPAEKFPKRLYIFVLRDTLMYNLSFYIDGNDNVKISGDRSSFPDKISIKGSKAQNDNLTFDKITQPLQVQYDSLNDLIGLKKRDTIRYAKSEIDNDRSKRNELQNQIEKKQIEFIKSNPGNYRALVEMFWLRDKIGKEEVRKLYGKIENKLKLTDYGKNIKIYLDLKNVLNEGDYFEDFQAKDSDGKLHNLSDFKGKYILLDFIQTYCYACLLSIDELKKIQHRYPNELIILTFCADKSEATWKTGLKENKVDWPSLWNGEGLNGKIPQLYGTDGTPTFVLIDPKGKIIKKEYGYGEGNLEKILFEVLEKNYKQKLN